MFRSGCGFLQVYRMRGCKGNLKWDAEMENVLGEGLFTCTLLTARRDLGISQEDDGPNEPQDHRCSIEERSAAVERRGRAKRATRPPLQQRGGGTQQHSSVPHRECVKCVRSASDVFVWGESGVRSLRVGGRSGGAWGPHHPCPSWRVRFCVPS